MSLGSPSNNHFHIFRYIGAPSRFISDINLAPNIIKEGDRVFFWVENYKHIKMQRTHTIDRLCVCVRILSFVVNFKKNLLIEK